MSESQEPIVERLAAVEYELRAITQRLERLEDQDTAAAAARVAKAMSETPRQQAAPPARTETPQRPDAPKAPSPPVPPPPPISPAPEFIVPGMGEALSARPAGTGATPAAERPAARPATAPVAQPRSASPRRPAVNLEELVAGQWFNYIGAVALLIAAALLLKLGYDRGWFSPTTICVIGWLVGAGVLAAGELTRPKTPLYGQVLTGLGAALLYLSTYFAHSYAGAISALAGVVMLAVVSVLMVFLALRHDSIPIAALGTLLGYATPVLMGGGAAGAGSPVPLFLYLIALSLVVLGISVPKRWSGFRMAAFAGTWIVFLGWYLKNQPIPIIDKGPVLAFLAVVFAIFVAVSVANPLIFRRDVEEVDVPLAVLNPVVFFGFVYLLVHQAHPLWLGWLPVGLAVGYWTLGRALYARLEESKLLAHLVNGIGHLFAVIAIPVLMEGRYLTVAWAAQAGVLLLVGLRADSQGTRRWAIAPMFLAIGRLLILDAWAQPSPGVNPVFDERGFAFLATLVALGIAGGSFLWERERLEAGSPARERKEVPLLLVALLFGALADLWIGLTVDVPWRFPLWAVLGGLVLAGGWQQKSSGLRDAGYILAYWGAIAVTFTSLLGGRLVQVAPTELIPGLIVIAVLFTVMSAVGLRQGESGPDWRLVVPLLATTAGLALVTAWLGLVPLWWPVAASIVAVVLLMVAALSGTRSVRGLALVMPIVPVLALFFVVGDAGMGPVSLAQLWPGFAMTIATFVCFCVMSASWGLDQQEQPLIPTFAGTAVALAFWWAHLGLDPGWSTLVWALVAVAALLGGERLGNSGIRLVGGLAALAVAFRAILYETALPMPHTVILHTRSLACLAAIAVCAFSWWRFREEELDIEGGGVMPAVQAWIASLLGLWWVSAEAMDLAAQASATGMTISTTGFGLSVAWALFAAGAIAVGFVFRIVGARVAGLALLSVTVFKVFILDVASLDPLYRILSFAVLGVILLSVAYAYQRFQKQIKGLLMTD